MQTFPKHRKGWVLLIPAALIVAMATGCTGSTQRGSASSDLPTDVNVYIPTEAGGRPVGAASTLGASLTEALPGVEEIALGEIASSGGQQVDVPAAFIAAINSAENVEGLREVLLMLGSDGATVDTQELAGVEVEYYDLPIGGDELGLNVVLEFLVVDDSHMVMVMSFEGKELAGSLMTAAINAAKDS